MNNTSNVKNESHSQVEAVASNSKTFVAAHYNLDDDNEQQQQHIIEEDDFPLNDNDEDDNEIAPTTFNEHNNNNNSNAVAEKKSVDDEGDENDASVANERYDALVERRQKLGMLLKS